MTEENHLCGPVACLAMGSALLLALAGCTTPGSTPGRADGEFSNVSPPATSPVAETYDYFPRYEIYYSPTMREYVYRDGFAWVRRPEPRGVTAADVLASPSVRMDFQDAPSRHHRTVVRNYPKDWVPPALTEVETVDHSADLDGHRDDEDARRNERNAILIGNSP